MSAARDITALKSYGPASEGWACISENEICSVCLLLQYPGVAQSINSDIDNLVGVLKLWNIVPEGQRMSIHHS